MARAWRWTLLVGLGAAACSFIAYGLAGDWGNTTTDDLPAESGRRVLLVLSGSAVLLWLFVASVGLVGLVVSAVLRRRS